MPYNLNTALDYARDHHKQFLDDLKEFVHIPSISTDPTAKPAIHQAAQWVAQKLEKLGMQKVQILPTSGHPVVYGELMSVGPEKPTVLIYGHYDVQPAEPLELWESPAFEPTIRGDNLYGRGASDMKGQIVITLKAVESLARTCGMPINIKYMVEGEEEVGSPHLAAFINAHKDLLACDFALNPDSGMIGSETPTIVYGLRGLAYFELRIFGPAHDLHSGLYGGVVHNPAQVLCELIAGMHDSQGHITLPGFYNRVQALSSEERTELARLPLGEEFYTEQTGAPDLFGEAGYTPAEQVGARPTLEVNGLLSGFTGEGSKTVLPAKAMAKISMRLVPDQDPDEVQQQLIAYLENNAPPTIHWEVINLVGGPATITDRQIPGVIALSQALETTWGKLPVFRREGGSVPVVPQMQKILGVESVMTGFGLPDDNLHAPNEKFYLPSFYRGIEAIIRYFCILGGEQVE
jgi:acetylornithine deacetylase/succinyl-diaminopimelate desuccinylase-like protein